MMNAEQRATTMAIDWKAIATQVGDLNSDGSERRQRNGVRH